MCNQYILVSEDQPDECEPVILWAPRWTSKPFPGCFENGVWYDFSTQGTKNKLLDPIYPGVALREGLVTHWAPFPSSPDTTVMGGQEVFDQIISVVDDQIANYATNEPIAPTFAEVLRRLRSYIIFRMASETGLEMPEGSGMEVPFCL